MPTLAGKTILITGASRGIGRAIALRCAADGAHLVLAAKSVTEHATLPGTVHTVAEEVEAAGGKALAIKLDVRDDAMIEDVVSKAADHFGGIDVLVNNAGYISLTGTEKTSPKRFDLMMGINVRAAFACSRACLPHLLRSDHAHILNMSPPVKMESRWFKDHAVYTVSKYGMTMLTIGMAAELAEQRVAVNSLWPRTTIATAAIQVHFPEEIYRSSRKPEIMADAAHAILCKDPAKVTGQTVLDEDVLREEGVTEFDHYAVEPGRRLFPDLYV